MGWREGGDGGGSHLHSFSNFIESLVKVRHCSKLWGYRWEQNRRSSFVVRGGGTPSQKPNECAVYQVVRGTKEKHKDAGYLSMAGVLKRRLEQRHGGAREGCYGYLGESSSQEIQQVPKVLRQERAWFVQGQEGEYAALVVRSQGE